MNTWLKPTRTRPYDPADDRQSSALRAEAQRAADRLSGTLAVVSAMDKRGIRVDAGIAFDALLDAIERPKADARTSRFRFIQEKFCGITRKLLWDKLGIITARSAKVPAVAIISVRSDRLRSQRSVNDR
jgi:hypothetical protein